MLNLNLPIQFNLIGAIVNRMNLDFNSALKIGGFSVFSALFLMKAWDIRSKRKSVNTLQSRETKMQNPQQMKSLKEGEQGYFKVKITKSPIVTKRKDIRYNQYYCCEPSLVPVTMQTKQDLQNEKEELKFYVSDEKGGSICIKGVGQLIGDVFELQHTHTKNSLGFFKTLYGLICWFTESFFHYNIFRGRYIYRSSSYKRRPLILGPVIGTINYIITLITKSYVIVKCKVVNGELVGQLIAESKGELVNHYGNKIHIQYFKLFWLFLGTFLFGRLVLKDVRRWISLNIVKKGLMGKKLFQHQVSEQKQCIICYTESRNIIFYDCRHMAMCYECYEIYRQQSCPVCKAEINEFKVLYEAQ